MIGYLKEEILSATKIARHFSSVLNKLKNHEINKIAISRNNELESVILPIDEYERLVEMYEYMEHQEIYKTIKEREQSSIGETISFESILEENGIDENEL